MDYNTTGTPPASMTTPVTFASWQASTGGDANSRAGIAGTGDFTTAMFVNAAAGDLHLVPGGNALVNHTGTAVGGITTDYDGEARSATTPFIGADELALPNIAIAQTGALTDGLGGVDFGLVTLGGSSQAKTFTISNSGTADLTGLAVSKDGAQAGEYAVSAPSSTTLAPGGAATFTVTFTPAASGTRTAAIHLASNVSGPKNPFDIALTGTGQTVFAAWAAANGIPSNPSAPGANGQPNLINFAFGMNPTAAVSGALRYAGTLAGGGTITANGLPITMIEGSGADIRALYVRRKDFVAAGLTYATEFSAALDSWELSLEPPLPTVLADDGTWQIVSVPYPPLVGGSAPHFFRVRVTVLP